MRRAPLIIVLGFVRVPKNGQIFLQWGTSTSSSAKAKYLTERWEGWEVRWGGLRGQGPIIVKFFYWPLCHCLIFGCLITVDLMYLLIVFLPLLGSSVAGFFGRFLGSEGTAIMTTTPLFALFSISFLGFLIFFRRFCSISKMSRSEKTCAFLCPT